MTTTTIDPTTATKDEIALHNARLQADNIPRILDDVGSGVCRVDAGKWEEGLLLLKLSEEKLNEAIVRESGVTT